MRSIFVLLANAFQLQNPEMLVTEQGHYNAQIHNPILAQTADIGCMTTQIIENQILAGDSQSLWQ